MDAATTLQSQAADYLNCASEPRAFHTRPERTTQLDPGLVYAAERLSFSTSLFYSDVEAQMPPFEARMGLDYMRGAWSAGALVRIVADQDRYSINQGNIIGQDLGPTDGFSVFSLNGGWRPREGMLLTAGVDNLFDLAYAEHLSRGGAMVSGFEQTTRVNEPGRTLWMKLDLKF